MLGWAFGFEPVCIVPQKDGTIDFCIVSALLWQSDVVEYHNFCIFQHTSGTTEEVIEKYILHVKTSH